MRPRNSSVPPLGAVPSVAAITAYCLLAATAGFGEPISVILDEHGRPCRTYQIDAFFPDGIIVRSEGRTLWLDIPANQHDARDLVLKNQGIPAPPPVQSGISGRPSTSLLPTESPTNPRVHTEISREKVQMTLNVNRQPQAVKNAITSIRSAKTLQDRHAKILAIPGAGSPRELPWEFVSNEIAMLLIWFSCSDENNPDHAAMTAYIKQQHRQPVLLYRLLIRPWLSKEKRQPGAP